MECDGIVNARGNPSNLPVDVSLLSLAIAGVGAPIMITDVDDRIVWTNRAFSELSCLPAQLITRMSGRSFGRGEHQAQTDQFPLRNDGKPQQIELIRLSATRSDGTAFVADAVMTPLSNGDGTVTHFVTVFHDVTQSAAALEQARMRVTQDELTGVACRSYIVELLHAAFAVPRTPPQLLALLFVDLDGFKRINDSFGHLVGDCLLKAVAARLAGVVRHSDTVARFGGDEFLIFLPNVSGRRAAKQIGSHIVQQLARPFAIGPALHYISASVGIAFRPDHGESAEMLLLRADEAMYRAKGRGGNQMAVATRSGQTGRATRFEGPTSWHAGCHVHNISSHGQPPTESRNE